MASQIRDPFSILGIEPDATSDEVEEAFLRLAKIYHPDRFASAPTDVRDEAQRRMQDLNWARDAIKGGYRPEDHLEAAANEFFRRSYQDAAQYTGPACVLCGHAPTAYVEFKSQFGQIFKRLVETWTGELCRNCGEAVYRDMQNSTLIKGWWGVISFFANFMYVFNNWNERRTSLSSLGPPMPTPRTFISPTSQPLPSGNPLWKRAGIYVSAVLLFALGWGFSGSTESSNTSSPDGRACSELGVLLGEWEATDDISDDTFVSAIVAAQQADDAELRAAGNLVERSIRSGDADLLSTGMGNWARVCDRLFS